MPGATQSGRPASEGAPTNPTFLHVLCASFRQHYENIYGNLPLITLRFSTLEAPSLYISTVVLYCTVHYHCTVATVARPLLPAAYTMLIHTQRHIQFYTCTRFHFTSPQ